MQLQLQHQLAVYMYMCMYVCLYSVESGVATVSRIDKIIGLFCRVLSLLLGSFAKETYNFIDPTDQSHLIVGGLHARYLLHVCLYSYVYIYACTERYTCIGHIQLQLQHQRVVMCFAVCCGALLCVAVC